MPTAAATPRTQALLRDRIDAALKRTTPYLSRQMSVDIARAEILKWATDQDDAVNASKILEACRWGENYLLDAVYRLPA